MALRDQNSLILTKVESTPGTAESSLSASTDAVRAENCQIAPQPNVVQTNEYTGSLDGAGPIIGGMPMQISFDVYLKGSGTAATAPEWGKLMKACGWAETITSTAVPSSPEACGAGGSTTTAELGSSASTTAQAYRGMPINFSSGVTLSTFITNYTTGKIATLADTASGTINAGSNYQIPVNVLYKPASSGFSALTIWIYKDGLLWKFSGCRGNVALSLPANGPGKLTFTFTGRFVSKSDASVPASPTFDTTRPPIWYNGKFKYNRVASGIASLSLDGGVSVVLPDNPNDTEGFDLGELVSRRMTGSMDPLETLVATRDMFTDFRAGTSRILLASLGSAAGNRVGLTIPAAVATQNTPGNRAGIATTGATYEATGADAGAFLTIY